MTGCCRSRVPRGRNAKANQERFPDDPERFDQLIPAVERCARPAVPRAPDRRPDQRIERSCPGNPPPARPVQESAQAGRTRRSPIHAQAPTTIGMPAHRQHQCADDRAPGAHPYRDHRSRSVQPVRAHDETRDAAHDDDRGGDGHRGGGRAHARVGHRAGGRARPCPPERRRCRSPVHATLHSTAAEPWPRGAGSAVPSRAQYRPHSRSPKAVTCRERSASPVCDHRRPRRGRFHPRPGAGRAVSVAPPFVAPFEAAAPCAPGRCADSNAAASRW